jgi:hypothetical protein
MRGFCERHQDGHARGSGAPATALTPSPAHREAARARGSDVDALLDLLRSSLVEATHLIREIIATAPKDDINLATLKAKLLLFRGEMALFRP